MIGNIKICAAYTLNAMRECLQHNNVPYTKKNYSKPVFIHFNRIDIGMLLFKIHFFHFTRFSIAAGVKEQTKLKIIYVYILRYHHVVCEVFDFFLFYLVVRVYLFVTEKKCERFCMFPCAKKK